MQPSGNSHRRPKSSPASTAATGWSLSDESGTGEIEVGEGTEMG